MALQYDNIRWQYTQNLISGRYHLVTCLKVGFVSRRDAGPKTRVWHRVKFFPICLFWKSQRNYLNSQKRIDKMTLSCHNRSRCEGIANVLPRKLTWTGLKSVWDANINRHNKGSTWKQKSKKIKTTCNGASIW